MFLAYAVLYMVCGFVQALDGALHTTRFAILVTRAASVLTGYLAGAGLPVELFMNWKYSELGSTTKTSLGLENDER